MKKCTKCGVDKELTEFYRDKNRKDGRHPWCKSCSRAYTKTHPRSPEKARESSARYRKRNGSLLRQKGRDYVRENAARLRDYKLLYRYGITPEQYASMYQAQGGRCAICGDPEEWKTFRLGVDHDHDTGLVRGLLCSLCNLTLGDPNKDHILTKEKRSYINSPPAQKVLGEHRVPGW